MIIINLWYNEAKNWRIKWIIRITIKFIYNYDFDNLNEYIDNEMETITKDFENSEWGIIKAANDYLSILEKVKN